MSWQPPTCAGDPYSARLDQREPTNNGSYVESARTSVIDHKFVHVVSCK